MRIVFLLLAGSLAGCSLVLPLAPKPSEPDRPAPSLSTPAERIPELVNSKKAVGHRDFANAKKILPTVFQGLEEDIYCGCRYVGNVVHFASCNAKPRKNPIRAGRIEWEHVVPAWVIGHQRQCWQAGGRKNCTDNDPVFRLAEGDLNNLVPALGEVNGDRSNFAYSAWTSNPVPMYGSCATIVDFKERRVQPREEIRGRVARVTLYMAQTYRLALSAKDKRLMCAWARSYPVDQWERVRDERIIRVQGKGNPLVSDLAQLKTICL